VAKLGWLLCKMLKTEDQKKKKEEEEEARRAEVIS
jgi:hypothetical protein